MRLKDRVAIVTGAATGIGQAIAIRLSAEGAKVAVVDIDEAGAESTVKTIRSHTGEAIAIIADISKEEMAKKIAAETMHAFGQINILVNNAAQFVFRGVEATIEDWHRSLGTNIIDTSLVTKYAVEKMKKTGNGAIVITGSISSFVAQPNFVTYSVTKAGLLQMTRNFAMDFAPFKIRVNCVCPGPILTQASFRHMEQAKMSLEEFKAEYGRTTMLNRVAEPSEVASVVSFLVSDDASYVTAAHLMVDGGYVAM